MSIEITSLAILVTDEVGEEKLGMITAFCRTEQAKVEPSDLCAVGITQASVVVV